MSDAFTLEKQFEYVIEKEDFVYPLMKDLKDLCSINRRALCTLKTNIENIINVYEGLHRNDIATLRKKMK